MGLKNQYQLNKEIEELIQRKDSRNQKFSKTDIDFISRYSGSGGKARQGAGGRGVLDEFYTPDYICEYMYQLAVKYGYKKGHILEPSVATGKIIKPFYDRSNYKSITAFEINDLTKRICEISYPKVKVYSGYFETAFLMPDRFNVKMPKQKFTWLKNYPFDLIIGNPPYGQHKNRYSIHFKGKEKFKQIENFFMYKGMQLLKKGGLLVFITGSNFMRTGKTNLREKQMIGELAEFVDAFRLPKVFESSEVPTDILIFKRK